MPLRTDKTTVRDTWKVQAAMTTELDYGVANVTGALKAAGMWQNTVLLFVSDNGGPLDHSTNWPLRGGKGTDPSIIERRPTLFFLGHISPTFARFFAVFSLFIQFLVDRFRLGGRVPRGGVRAQPAAAGLRRWHDMGRHRACFGLVRHVCRRDRWRLHPAAAGRRAPYGWTQPLCAAPQTLARRKCSQRLTAAAARRAGADGQEPHLAEDGGDPCRAQQVRQTLLLTRPPFRSTTLIWRGQVLQPAARQLADGVRALRRLQGKIFDRNCRRFSTICR